MSLLEEGQIIRDGDYLVEKLIGVGFFAEVWRVKHSILGRQALKIFKTPGTLEEVKAMFEEARLLTGFGHRNIVRVFDAAFHETAAAMHGFFTMEYVAGGSLEQFRLLRKERLIPVPVAVDILRQACLGLSRAHARKPPLVHRDIKPQNILVDEDEEGFRVCVTDFGLAKHVNPIMLKASTRGTLCYRAPECFNDPQSASCAADVWSLGLTTYLLLTDRFPYAGADLDEIKPEHFKRPLVRASYFNGGVDEVLDEVIARALAVDPAERYPHVMALLKDLEEWQRQVARAQRTTFPADPSAEQEARQVVAQAIKISRSDLAGAADLLKKAMDVFPPFREEYRGLLKAYLEGKVG
jgi:serine/threonine protein kinase